MTNNITSTFPYPPYNDNYNSDDHIHRVLFKTGNSFTHEHLNLLQSILQEQIAVLGRHFYKNGSFVSISQYKILNSNNIYDIKQFTGVLDLKRTLENFAGTVLVHQKTGKTFTVLFAQKAETNFNKGEYDKLVFDSTLDTSDLYNDTNCTLKVKDTDQIINIQNSSINSYISFEPNVIFLQGYFLNFPKQYSCLPSSTCSIGIEIRQSIINAGGDPSLLDNARGEPSEGSEGADRYFLFPKLICYPIVRDSNYFDIVQKDEFIEYLRLENGVVVKDVTRPIYDEFAKTLARRTYDEAGNFTIDPFLIDIKKKNDDYFLINIGRGKAYIFGFEFDSLSTRSILLPKATNKFAQDGQVSLFPDFSYVVIPSLDYFIDTQVSEVIHLYDSLDQKIGSAACFYSEQKSISETRLYLISIALRDGSIITDVKTIKTNFGHTISAVTSFNITINLSDSFLVKAETITSIEGYSNLFCTYQKTYSGVVNNIINKNNSEEFKEDLIYYQAFDNNKNKVHIKSVSINVPDNIISFDTDIPIFYIIVNEITGILEKLTSDIIDKTMYVTFNNTDILINDKVDVIKDITFNNKSILSQFNIKEYSTPTYNYGTILSYVGIDSSSMIGNSIKIIYSYHDNYIGQIDYTKPSLDFRKNNQYTVPSIKPNSKIRYSYTKSLDRYDKLVLTANKTFELIHGVPDNYPVPPKDRQDAMTLYTLFIPANINLPSSIGIKFVENKRYTMRDIGKLDTRIENLEFYTALNLLEKKTSDQSFPDTSGNARFKNGFIVDNFKTYKSVSLDTKDAHFSLDTNNGILRPSFLMKNLDMVYSPGESTTQLTGELITMPYREVNFIAQLEASDVLAINSFSVFVYEGKMTLSPQTDNWVDTETAPTVNLNQYGETDVYASLGEKGFNSQWGSWESNILSVDSTKTKNASSNVSFADSKLKIEKRLWNPSVDPSVGKSTIDAYNTWIASGFTQGFTQTKPDGYISGQPAILLNFKGQETVSTQKTTDFQQSQILTNQLSNNVSDIAISPFQRALSVRLDISCLKPNTKFFVLFDKTDVTKLCYIFGSKEQGDLISNSYGYLTIVCDLPAKQFKTGTHIFKVVDTLSINTSMISSFAVGNFFSNGMTQTKTLNLISTREPVTVSNEKLFDTVEAVFDTSVLKKTFKITLDIEGDASVEIQNQNNKVILTGKPNTSVSVLINDGDSLFVYMTEKTQKLTSYKGLPYFDKDDNAKYSYVCKDFIPKEDVIIKFRFDEPKTIKVEIALGWRGYVFTIRPFPYYSVRAETFNNGIIETTLQYRQELLDRTAPPLPSPTPSMTISPTATITPTVSISPAPGFSTTPTPSPTPTPTSSVTLTPTQTASPTPTPYFSPTPSPTLLLFDDLPFNYSIITSTNFKTKVFNLVIGDKIECNFFDAGLPVVNNMDIPSSITGVNWDKNSTLESAFLVVTEDTLMRVGSDTLRLLVNPIDNNVYNLAFRSLGNDITLRWILTDNISSTTISFSGFITVQGTGKWFFLDKELLEIIGKIIGYIRLIPADEKSRAGVKKFADISIQSDTMIILPQGPIPIMDEVYSGTDMDYLTPSKPGINVQTLEDTGELMPFLISDDGKKIQYTFYIELSPLILQTPIPTPTPSHSSVTPTPSPSVSARPMATPSPTPIIKKGTSVDTKGLALDGTSISLHDPLAESFFIDENLYPEGVLLSSVELFFWKADYTLPVTVEIRQSVNSYPSDKEIIPFSIVTLPSSLIFTSEDASLSTYFRFPSPVFLLPGEYHLVVITDSPNYQLWIGTIGHFKVNSPLQERITKNPYSGVLFRSSNNTDWLSQQDSDLTFKINRCSFDTTYTYDAVINNASYTSNSDVIESPYNFTSMRLNAVTVVPEKTGLVNSTSNLLTSANTKKSINIELNSTVEINEVCKIKDSKFNTDTTPSMSNRITFMTIRENVSPIIDIQRLSNVLVYNIINKLETSADLDSELKSYGGTALAKYITKKVTLNLEIPANTISVSFAASLPKGTQVRSYFRVFNTVQDSSDFTIFDRPWQFLGLASKTSNSPDKFIDFSIESSQPFVYVGNTGITNFDTCMVKLVLESDNAANVPLIRDFRAIALTS